MFFLTYFSHLLSKRGCILGIAKQASSSSALPPELEAVPPEPAGPPAASLGLREPPPVPDAPRPLAGGGEAAQLTVLHHGARHPVDLGVAADGLVVRVDHDDLEVLVRRVLFGKTWVVKNKVNLKSVSLGRKCAQARKGFIS